MTQTCRNIGNLTLAKQYNQIALKIFVQVCGKDQLIVALILSSIASLYLDDITIESKYENQKRNFIFSENYQQVLECLNESIRIRKLHYNNPTTSSKTWTKVGYDLAHNMHSKAKLLVWNGEFKASLDIFQEEMRLREELLEKFIEMNQKKNDFMEEAKKNDDFVADSKASSSDDTGDKELQRKEGDHFEHIMKILLSIIQIHAQNNEYDNILSSCDDLLKRIDAMQQKNKVKKTVLNRNHADVLFLMGRGVHC